MAQIEQMLLDAWNNRVLISVIVGWVSAQMIKVLIHLFVNRRWSWERLFGAGGMPSSHAATVCALAVSSLLAYGGDSFAFTVSFVLAIVVLHDARGVRLETGRQAQILNVILREWKLEHNPFSDTILKELVGHTPLQVFVGGCIGVIAGVLIH